MRIHAVNAFNDNYIWILQPHNSSQCIVVDPGDAKPVLDFLQQQKLTPAAILITHHHHDHCGGIAELISKYPVPVYGPAGEEIAGVKYPLRGGNTVTELALTFDVMDCPGHTKGHIAYYCRPHLFCGDTLFSAGCGRMFEGTPEEFTRSLQRFAALPAETLIYCAHEYTAANLEFAATVEPENNDIQSYKQQVTKLCGEGNKTLPARLENELLINPFLRCNQFSVQQAAQSYARTDLANETEVFAVLRQWKDNF